MQGLREVRRPTGLARHLPVLARRVHRPKATIAQTASTTPNGHAPCRNPYTDPRTQEAANPNTNHALRGSSA